MQTFVLILDLLGTFVFALSGGMAALRYRLDLFGVLVLSFAAATAGGIARDVFIGAIPPNALVDWRYIAVSSAAGLTCFFQATLINRLTNPVRLFDALGLSVFAVAGSLKTLDFGLSPLTAIFLGMLTGIGGGMVRDILVARTPMVLRSELYALAALAGSAVVVAGEALDVPTRYSAIAGALLCFGMRMLAIRYGWGLPQGKPPQD
ncbi:MAG: trimeric intracellular cation channel family protein [Gammaproteobacteria bacterium]|nr:trimeric intracellular cation channel family protein [Gammaproteobacteria bacterium]